MKKIIVLNFIIALYCISNLYSQNTTNPDTVCISSTEYYNIVNANANSTFTWGIYHGSGTIVSGQGTDSINIAWTNSVGIDTLWVFEINAGNCKGDTAKIKVVRLAKPTAVFTDNLLCYGETLQVTFTGNAPYTLDYTLNGNPITQIGITTNPYTISTQSGNYQLVKVTDKNCVNTTLVGTTISVISTPLNTLQIIHK